MAGKPTRGFEYWNKASRGNGKYIDPETGEEIKFSPKPWNEGVRQSTGGVVPSTSSIAEKRGWKLVAQGVKCPLRGAEGGEVRYSIKGKSAIWDGGNVYMRPEDI